jgi:hypothetical protein
MSVARTKTPNQLTHPTPNLEFNKPKNDFERDVKTPITGNHYRKPGKKFVLESTLDTRLVNAALFNCLSK